MILDIEYLHQTKKDKDNGIYNIRKVIVRYFSSYQLTLSNLVIFDYEGKILFRVPRPYLIHLSFVED